MKLFSRLIFSLIVISLFSCQSRFSTYTKLENKDINQDLDSYKEYLSDAVGASQINPLNKEGQREKTLDYYSEIVGDRNIAELILEKSLESEIPPELAFALAFAESSFNTKAVNYNNHSIHRGLFQLNNRSFPDLEEKDFFDPEINISLGIKYLKHCLSMGGDEVTALAMYNAGPNRVKDSRTPQMTLKYISKIQKYKKKFQSESFIQKPEGILMAQVAYPSFKSVKNPSTLIDQIDKIN